MKLKLAKTTADIEKCFPVMVQLRTNLSKEEFMNRVAEQQKSGYQLVYIKHADAVVAVAGFRTFENLMSGKVCYVDDLVTDEKKRSHGFGDALIEWLIAFARKANCTTLQLDSGVQRTAAHRFYFRKRMVISSYRFSLPLAES